MALDTCTLSNKKGTPCGTHILAEMKGIPAPSLNNLQALKELLVVATKTSGATVAGIMEKQFTPSGVTILLLLEESHASIHTYPEDHMLFLDIFTCGTCDPHKTFEVLRKTLKPTSFTYKHLNRHCDH